MIDGPVQPAAGAPELIGLDSNAMGCTCADPMAGRGPRARPGELCPEWLWPFTDPGLVIRTMRSTWLEETDLIILPHEYGYCVYRAEVARCGGAWARVGLSNCIAARTSR